MGHQEESDVTETEKLARTIRLILLAVVGMVLVIVVGTAGFAAVRWGRDAVTTSPDERVTACVEAVDKLGLETPVSNVPDGPGFHYETPSRGYLELACRNAEADVDEAVKLVKKGGWLPLPQNSSFR